MPSGQGDSRFLRMKLPAAVLRARSAGPDQRYVQRGGANRRTISAAAFSPSIAADTMPPA